MSEVARVGPLVFLAVILQSAWFDGLSLGKGNADLLLVSLVAIALLRGSAVGASAGFAAGLLYDASVYGRLGFTSLLLTLAAYWTGRYGETTGRDRAHAPFLAVGVITALYLLGSLTAHFVLGDPAPAGAVIWGALPGELLLNLILAAPVYWLCRRLIGSRESEERAAEVQLLA
ncbi:MAG: rod shape-determining protein MreD [Gaiellaceae bacterium]